MEKICIGRLQPEPRVVECAADEKRMWFGTFYVPNGLPLVDTLLETDSITVEKDMKPMPWNIVDLCSGRGVLFNVRLEAAAVFNPGWYVEDPDTMTLIRGIKSMMNHLKCEEKLYVVSQIDMETGELEVIDCSLCPIF